jgi:hypothetical protein
MKLYKKNTKLSITIIGDGQEIFDYSLPHPTKYTRNGNRYTLEYTLNGYFNTKSSYEYLNDIIARFTLSMKVIDTNISSTKDKGLELSYFKGLKSIIRAKNYESVDVGKDNVFWSIKLYTEALIREYGEGKLVAYSLLESYSMNTFIDRAKDKSTLKAKCRSIWNWYNDIEWIIPTRKGKGMSRAEGAKIAHTKLAADTKRKILSVITGIFQDEYKKKSGKWNISKIAKDSKTSRNTVMKYTKEYDSNK